jgi:hypothetical protein
MLKRVMVLIFLLLAACATSPGQTRKTAEMAWEERTLPKDYRLVYKNFLTGFEVCASGSLFIPDSIGFPECSADFDGKIVQCTIYHSQVVGPRADRVLGSLTIKSAGNGTAGLRAGYNPEFATKQSLKYWMRFAEGNYQCK